MEKKIVRIALVALAILAIGILVLPSTITLFAGQHTWYYKEALPCDKCHADVADEFRSADNYHPPGNTYPIWEACVLCHQVEPLYPGDVSPAADKHAATVVPCEYCHYPEAYAFDNDPHFEFVKTAEGDDQMPNGTEACVACHTHARLDISFDWAKYMTFEFKVDPTADRSDAWIAGEGLWDNIAHGGYGTGFGYVGSETHYVFEYGAYSNIRHTDAYTPPER
jgi:hypothetical protein